MPDRMPDRMPEDMSDRMPEDLPVTKCINVMVRITRSNVICTTFYNSHCSDMAALPLYFKIPILRKKIEGAIQVCMQDEKHLVRPGSEVS
jgi:hypothetical protein